MNSIEINSEIGRLKGVILHKPGTEIEQMTPQTTHHALYSDLLNLKIASKEYSYFQEALSSWCETYEVTDLLEKVLDIRSARIELIKQILSREKKDFLYLELLDLPSNILAKYLIEGYPFVEGQHPEQYREGRFVLDPLYNLFFTRDASSSLYNHVFIHAMRTEVRARESLVMESIFKYIFNTETINPKLISQEASTEGGDFLIAKKDILFVGNGLRTNKKGIEFLCNYFAARKPKQKILVQELPQTLDSFIHLDMVFNFLSQNECIAYTPLICKQNSGFNTTIIEIDNGKISFKEEKNFLQATKTLGFDLKPIACGGEDSWIQQREQWHSGANFFCMGEGKIIGYERNTYTIEELDKNGFDVVRAQDIAEKKDTLANHSKCVVTVEASELPRGCGGARCMTMPVFRQEVNW